MIGMRQLRSIMQSQSERDRHRRYVNISAVTLEDAINRASVELSVPTKHLEYEILARGSRGFVGIGKKSWLILAYQLQSTIESQKQPEEASDEEEMEASKKDGTLYVRLGAQGVSIKICRPIGAGKPITVDQTLAKIRQRTDGEVDEMLVRQAVDRMDNKYVRVGDYRHDPKRDSTLSVSITDSNMKAWLSITKPGEGGGDLSAAEIRTYLREIKVTTGILEDTLLEIEDTPRYNQPILVAAGQPAINGQDARLVYNFEDKHEISRVHIEDGKVDFKELNLIQNVLKDQVLVKKHPPQVGVNGFTIDGSVLPAQDGKDVSLKVGKHVTISEDGLRAIADANGHVMNDAGRIYIEKVYTIEGNVNLKTGNITFLGSVVVKGNVDDGFSIKATGSIEILGTVGRANLHAEGDIIVHRGIVGKNEADIQCGTHMWSRFIENASVDVKGYVVVSDGIINSTVSTEKQVICRGKRARIVGGRIYANEGVDAKVIGSAAGIETIIEVGYDPKHRRKLVQMQSYVSNAQNEIAEIQVNVRTYEHAKAAKRKLSDVRRVYFNGLEVRLRELERLIDEKSKEIKEMQEYLDNISINAKVSIQRIVYAGVRVKIKEVQFEVRNELKNLTFIQEANMMKIVPYEEAKETINVSRR